MEFSTDVARQDPGSNTKIIDAEDYLRFHHGTPLIVYWLRSLSQLDKLLGDSPYAEITVGEIVEILRLALDNHEYSHHVGAIIDQLELIVRSLSNLDIDLARTLANMFLQEIGDRGLNDHEANYCLVETKAILNGYLSSM